MLDSETDGTDKSQPLAIKPEPDSVSDASEQLHDNGLFRYYLMMFSGMVRLKVDFLFVPCSGFREIVANFVDFDILAPFCSVHSSFSGFRLLLTHMHYFFWHPG